ncbi:hypothetical protein BJ875DRAFT_227448 [Amylocarpus encephaloides]|uniref:Short-chain dehydrogenase n=1 Tax=Amylocarpus encephaloides TaxID=45428 RepID=A0A9P7YMR3_9HELO|nr:hypothetical protein BJ875DRAFT_227448 [Amylocarpus encephaloides]
MGNTPSAPTLTEKNLPDQAGKVFMITGSTSGVGLSLAQILYAHNARIYIAARSAEKADYAIGHMKSLFPDSRGSLVYLHLDLNDLSTIKSSAEEFLKAEKQLDVLWNNAGLMIPAQGSKTKQGTELQLGTNCVAPWLFTRFLTPVLRETARVRKGEGGEEGGVRVVWVSSSAAAKLSPQGGVEMDNLDYGRERSAWVKYGVSKAGNILHGWEYGRRAGGEGGVLSVSLDPGNLKTDLYKSLPRWQRIVVDRVLKEPIYGAYTELYAGLSIDITMENQGAFIVPWGKMQPPRADIVQSCKSADESGTGIARQFWEWTEGQCEGYM